MHGSFLSVPIPPSIPPGICMFFTFTLTNPYPRAAIERQISTLYEQDELLIELLIQQSSQTIIIRFLSKHLHFIHLNVYKFPHPLIVAAGYLQTATKDSLQSSLSCSLV